VQVDRNHPAMIIIQTVTAQMHFQEEVASDFIAAGWRTMSHLGVGVMRALHRHKPKRDRRRAGKRQKSTGLFNRSRSWLLYSAFAETFLAFRRIDFVPRLRWLLDLLQSCAITGGANSFGQNFTLFLHKRPIIKIRQKVESI
jgi:hypothetical protein